MFVSLYWDMFLPPHFPRAHAPKSIEALKRSIMRHGVLQPVIVCKEGDKYRIIAGAGRVEACKQLGIQVPCIVADSMETAEQLLKTFAENEARSAMSPVEKGEFLQKYIQMTGCDQESAAESLDISPSYASKLLTVKGNLAPDLLGHVHTGKLDIASAHAISRLKDHDEQRELAQKAMEGLLKRAKVIERVKAKLGAKVPKAKNITIRFSNGMVVTIPNTLANEAIITTLQSGIDGVRKLDKHGLPKENLPDLLA